MYHILPLSSEEIRDGILFQISDAVDAAFNESVKSITEQGLRGDKEEILILFENSSTNPSFWDTHGEDVQDVLYLNDAAKDAIEQAGVKINTTGTTEERPQGGGLMTRMYRFINLR